MNNNYCNIWLNNGKLLYSGGISKSWFTNLWLISLKDTITAVD